MRTIKSASVMIALFAMLGEARATVPAQFSVQGVLRDNAGKLQSMAVNITVRLFAAETGGTPLSTPLPTTSVVAVNGLFTVTVGVDSALAAILANPPVWLELTAGTDTFPRQLMTANVYALQSGVADSLSAACSGCVTNGMLSIGIDATKITTGVLGVANGGTGTSGVENWTELADAMLQNSWVHSGTTFTSPAYYKDPFGIVRIKGFVQGGNVATNASDLTTMPNGVILVLGAGYRPAHTLILQTQSNQAGFVTCTIYIFPSGEVQAEPTCGKTWISLDGLSFRVGS